MPWRNYVAGLTDATLGTLSGRNVGRVRKSEREAAIAKTSRQAGWQAGWQDRTLGADSPPA